MAVLKCKMCGGTLEIQEGSTVCECEYCGSKQTIPTVQDEGLQTLYNRANILRMKSEFDKAAEVYEKILQKKNTESEAYWGLILCKYGIEYVEDPKTYLRIPTCHRTSYESVTADEDYKNALRYAKTGQQVIYEDEAKRIDEIQKGILSIVQKEDPYDIFICYKETDEKGKRTPDSVIANDVYHQLTQEGFKVFYAAITLEDKLGTEYEPYIFSALNTSKVMLVIGTKPEYFNSVWVKNEWSRFLKNMKKDRNRLLIPCYRDMDPYELPEEFAHLQAQDMSKIGFINDIVRGIKKVIVKYTPQASPAETVAVQSVAGSGTTVTAQIKRGNMALEDHEWDKAEGFFEEALNLDPECAEAYIGKLLVRDNMPDLTAWLTMQKEKNSTAITERLEACSEDTKYIERKVDELQIDGYLLPDAIRKCYEYDRGYESTLSCRKQQRERQLSELESDRLLTRACQYAKGEIKSLLDEALSEITLILDKRIKAAQEEDNVSIALVKEAYKDYLAKADKKADEVNNDAQNRREKRYQDAVSAMEKAFDRDTYIKAYEGLKAMKGYKDSDYLADICQKEISRIDEEEQFHEEEKRQEQERQEAIRKAEAEQKARKTRKLIKAIAAVAAVCAAVVFVSVTVVLPKQKMDKAMALMENGDYEDAIVLFDELGDYKDSKEQKASARAAWENAKAEEKKATDYAKAESMFEGKMYENAMEIYLTLGDYKNSKERIEDIQTILDKEYGEYLELAYTSAETDLNSAGEYLEKIPESYEPAKSLREIYNRYRPYCGIFLLTKSNSGYGYKGEEFKSLFVVSGDEKVSWCAQKTDSSFHVFSIEEMGVGGMTKVENMKVRVQFSNESGKRITTDVRFVDSEIQITTTNTLKTDGSTLLYIGEQE